MVKSLVLYGISAMLLVQGVVSQRLFYSGRYLISQAEASPGYITPTGNNHEVNLTPERHVWEVSFSNGGFTIRSVEKDLYLKGFGKPGPEHHGNRGEIQPVILEHTENPQAWAITEFDEETKSYRVEPLGDHETVLSHTGPDLYPLVLQNKEYGNKATHQLWRFVQAQ